MTKSILRLSRQLIDRLNASGVGYCSWKENQELSETLVGKEDIDLLVRREDFHQFESIIRVLGFKEATAYVQYPSIFHYYGLDYETGKFIHLHVHLKIITGESYVKNYHFPVEKMILENLKRHPSGINIPQAEVEFILVLLRFYVKVSCLAGAVLLRREQREYEEQMKFLGAGLTCEQMRFLGDAIDFDRIGRLLGEHLSTISPEFLMELADGMREEVSFSRKFILGMRLRWRIACFRRFGIAEGFIARYRILGAQLLKRRLLGRKKALVSGGALIAITGLDGSGKSTQNKKLYDWLRVHFNTHALHVGRPRPLMETIPFRAALWGRRCFGSNQAISDGNSGKQGTVFALRHLVLAYERLQTLKRANRLRANGDLVLCDRYPSRTRGKMDSPRIVQAPGNSGLVNFLGRIEDRLYKSMPVPDCIFNLQVPLELALVRNSERQKKGKETDEELRQRYLENSNLQYTAAYFETIDATRNLDEVFHEIGGKIWSVL